MAMNEQDMNELREIMRQVVALSDQIDALQAQKDALKTQLEEGVAFYGGTVGFDGIGTAYTVKGKSRVSYDAKALDKLIATLVADGELHTAKALSDIRKETVSKDYISVKRDGGK